MKKIIQYLISRTGYAIQRIPAGPTRETTRRALDQVLEKCRVPVMEPMDLAAYQNHLKPLFSSPTRIPPDFTFTHYRKAEDAVRNESMQNYFRADTKPDGSCWITDDYPDAHYYWRQRMLLTVYQRFWPQGLAGVSALDIGCSSGYYSFYLARAGVRLATGIDARPEHEDQFALLSHMLNLTDNVRYQTMDMETGLDGLNEASDLVLAQGVMYHVYDHPRFVRNLYRLTGKVLVLETACSGFKGNICSAYMEDVGCLRASIHGPVIFPSLSWAIELLRWAGFKDVHYVRYPDDMKNDSSNYRKMKRAMLVGVK